MKILYFHVYFFRKCQEDVLREMRSKREEDVELGKQSPKQKSTKIIILASCPLSVNCKASNRQCSVDLSHVASL